MRIQGEVPRFMKLGWRFFFVKADWLSVCLMICTVLHLDDGLLRVDGIARERQPKSRSHLIAPISTMHKETSRSRP